MKNIQKVMVALDLSEMDPVLIKYSLFLGSLFPEIDEIIFVHNIKHRFPDAVLNDVLKLDRPMASYVEEDIIDQVNNLLLNTDPGFTTRAIVREHISTTDSLIQIANENQVDLMLLGKKNVYAGSGIVPGKLLRMAECNLLFVPETAYNQISNILVPIDFSAHSTTALEFAFAMKAVTDAPVKGLHVYSLPQRYFPYIPVDEVKTSVEDHAKQAYQKFYKLYSELERQRFECTFTSNKGKSIAAVIATQALSQKADFLIVGARGKSPFAALMVGSVAVGLSNSNLHIPMMVVK